MVVLYSWWGPFESNLIGVDILPNIFIDSASLKSIVAHEWNYYHIVLF